MGGQFEREGFNKLYGWEFKNKISTKKILTVHGITLKFSEHVPYYDYFYIIYLVFIEPPKQLN